MKLGHVLIAVLGLFGGTVGVRELTAEVCTTQSQMKEADRTSLTTAARTIVGKVQAGDAAGLRGDTIAEVAKNFGAIQYLVNETAPKLKGGTLTVNQIYLLDGTEIKGAPVADAQFFCLLNRSTAEADFLIPGLTPGRYAFAVVESSGTSAPWQVSLLLQQGGAAWKMAGVYPKATTAAGHDGLWYWTTARSMATVKQKWNAWLYFGEAEALLKPANFVQSTHLEKLRAEQTAAAPPALSNGVSADTPLVVKGANGAEFRFTGIGMDDSLAKDKVDVAAHLAVDSNADTVAARKRNVDAMTALVSAYPELRSGFHGVWIYAEAAGQNPFATEQAMDEIH